MKTRLFFFIKYFIFWFLVFFVARAIFLLYNYNQSSHLQIVDIVKSFLYGSRMDLSMVGYYMVIPGLVLMLTTFSRNNFLYYFFKIYTIVILVITCFIVISDMELYRHWGFRMDSTPLLYLKNPKEVIGSFDIAGTIISIGIGGMFFTLSFFLCKRVVLQKLKNIHSVKWFSIPAFLFITGLLFIPIRGSFGVSPMSLAFVYFHQNNMFANHSAVNVVWNIAYSIDNMDEIKGKKFFDDDKANKIFEQLMKSNSETQKKIKIQKPNVIIILLESFSSKLIAPLGGMDSITPNLNKLCNESLVFTNCYASGDRTDKGMLAVLSGFPAQPTTSIIKYPEKVRKLPFISAEFKKQNYSTQWIFGGDNNFANYKSYLINGKFDKIIGINDFAFSVPKAKWGVHDHIVFDYIYQETLKMIQPFFITALTLSSHEPYDIPTNASNENTNAEQKFLNATNYTDKCVGEFIEKAKKSQWWNNTLIIITADHGNRHPNNSQNWGVDKFKIPMIWTGGAITQPEVISTYCSQTDLAKTLLRQLGMESYSFVYSNDMLAEQTDGFAYFSFNNGFGFLKQDIQLIFDNVTNEYFYREGNNSGKYEDSGKAILQVLMNDFLKK